MFQYLLSYGLMGWTRDMITASSVQSSRLLPCIWYLVRAKGTEREQSRGQGTPFLISSHTEWWLAGWLAGWWGTKDVVEHIINDAEFG